jgi:hypothetical protein
MFKNNKTKISLEHYDMTLSAEMPASSSYTEVMDAFNGLMISAGYSKEWLLEFCNEYVEANEYQTKEND